MSYFCSGDMAEWSIAAVLKTVERFAFQGFESLSLRKKKQASEMQVLASFFGQNGSKSGQLNKLCFC